MQLMGWKDKGNVGGREDCVAVVLGGEKVVEEVWRKQSACWREKRKLAVSARPFYLSRQPRPRVKNSISAGLSWDLKGSDER